MEYVHDDQYANIGSRVRPLWIWVTNDHGKLFLECTQPPVNNVIWWEAYSEYRQGEQIITSSYFPSMVSKVCHLNNALDTATFYVRW